MTEDDGAGFELAGVAVDVEDARLLSAVDLCLPAATWTTLLGPSGSGKSTLLRLLNRLIEPSAGEVRFRARPLAEYDVRALRRRVGLVVQQPQLSGGTAQDNLELPVKLGSITAEQARQRTEGACEVAQLDRKLLQREVAGLSGGERQRVALARAMMLEPEALLLDEPTSALDPDTARRVLAALEALRASRGLTLVMVTHRLEELTGIAQGARCAVLAAGSVVETGLARTVLDDPQHAVTRTLLGREVAHADAD